MTTRTLEFLEGLSLRRKDGDSALVCVQPEADVPPFSTQAKKVEAEYGHDYNGLRKTLPLSPISPLPREAPRGETSPFDDKSEEGSRALMMFPTTGKNGESGESLRELPATRYPLSDSKWKNWNRSKGCEHPSFVDRAIDHATTLHVDASLPLHDAHRKALAESFGHLFDVCPGLAGRATSWVIKGCPFVDSLAAVGLQEMAPPHDWPSKRWSTLQHDALSFAENWSATAASAGWQSWELWGCSRYAPYRRIDGLGLIAMIAGARLTDIDSKAAAIATENGSVLRYRRKGSDPLGSSERVMVWQVATVSNGQNRMGDDVSTPTSLSTSARNNSLQFQR